MKRDTNSNKMLVMSELIGGMEAAEQLKLELSSNQSSMFVKGKLIEKIMESNKKAILLLNQNEQISEATQPSHRTLQIVPESPASINGSPTSANSNTIFKEINPKKRKMMQRWTEHVRVNPEINLEGPQDDGYNWRKYGQKDILGAKYPRSYYRCTYKHTQNCWATKQVQRSDHDPSIFEISYRGTHTCVQSSLAPPASGKLARSKLETNLAALRSSLTVETEGLGPEFSFPSTNVELNWIDKNDGFCNGFPRHEELDHYSLTPNRNFQYRESDLGEIISATNSASSSPMFDAGFSLHHFEVDPSFEFDYPTFFSY